MEKPESTTERDDAPGKAGDAPAAGTPPPPARPVEIGGPKGPEPTRYHDWEKGGRCIDFRHPADCPPGGVRL